jgi:hypothetical protein
MFRGWMTTTRGGGRNGDAGPSPANTTSCSPRKDRACPEPPSTAGANAHSGRRVAGVTNHLSAPDKDVDRVDTYRMSPTTDTIQAVTGLAGLVIAALALRESRMQRVGSRGLGDLLSPATTVQHPVKSTETAPAQPAGPPVKGQDEVLSDGL